MHVYNLKAEQAFDPKKHMERVLGRVGEGDVTIACWEAGQTSPYHCHPEATEIYFCFEGGGTMRTPDETIEIGPGAFVVHPRGELHEYANGPQRTLLFRCATATGCRAAPKNGRAIPNGDLAPRTSTISRPDKALPRGQSRRRDGETTVQLERGRRPRSAWARPALARRRRVRR
jgi:quercetin dioxygenase-like cupin family protein